MTDTPAASGTLVERLREYAADCDEGIVSDYETPGLLAREAADELAAANERIRSFDQTDSASCVGTGCKASSLTAQLSACRAELAQAVGVIEDRNAELAAAQEECLATFNLAAEQQAAKEESERLLADAIKFHTAEHKDRVEAERLLAEATATLAVIYNTAGQSTSGECVAIRALASPK